MHLSIVRAFDLQCEIKIARYWKFLGDTITCEAKNVDINSPDQVLTSINGQFVESFQRHNVKGLNIRDQTVNFMPKGLEKFFPKLKGLYVAGCNLNTIEKADLEHFTQLEELNLYHNNIKKIDSNLFENNLELRHISFWDCKIISIDENTFDNLTKLENLHLFSNKCINKDANGKDNVPRLIAEVKENCSPLSNDVLQAKLFEKELENAELNQQLETEKKSNVEMSLMIRRVRNRAKKEIDELNSELEKLKSNNTALIAENAKMHVQVASCVQ